LYIQDLNGKFLVENMMLERLFTTLSSTTAPHIMIGCVALYDERLTGFGVCEKIDEHEFLYITCSFVQFE